MFATLSTVEGKKPQQNTRENTRREIQATTKNQTQLNFRAIVTHKSSKILHKNLLVCAGKLKFLLLGLVCIENH